MPRSRHTQVAALQTPPFGRAGHPAAPPETAELLERGDQLSALNAQFDDVSGRAAGRLALVRGEAGIGKTALLREFTAALAPSVRVLWATCDPLFTPRPLGPLLDIARATGGELAERIDAGAKPHDVAAALIAELESPAPTVVVLEDLHWADEATLDVVRLCAGRIPSVAALLIASYRDDQLDRAHPLRIVLGELPSRAPVSKIEVARLSRAAVVTLAAESKLDGDELYERTGGNPFYVTEALAAETERVPETVRAAVLARVARLSIPARSVLDAVAVVPLRAEVWLLEALTDNALDGLDECLSSGMLRAEPDGVGFRHELARLAVEEALTPDRAVMLHRRAIRALAEPAIGAPDFARLAHHADAASDAESVLRYAPAAAEQAAARGALREAQSQYARALRFGQSLSPDRRAELLEGFAEQCYLTDMRHDAIAAVDELLQIHRELADLPKEAGLLRFRARLLSCMGRMAEARSDVRAAVSVLEQAPAGNELAHASARQTVAMMEDDIPGAIFWGERIIELAERDRDVPTLTMALNNTGFMELIRGREGGLEKLERSLELALAADDGPEVGRAYINTSGALAHLHRWREAERYLEPGIAFCAERGLEAWEKTLVGTKTRAELAMGRFSEAAEMASRTLNEPEGWNVGPRNDARIVLALVRARRGDPGYGQLLDEALEAAHAADDLDLMVPAAAARAEVAWLEGRGDAIGAETQVAFERARGAGYSGLVGHLASWRARAGLSDGVADEACEPWRWHLTGEFERATQRWRELGCTYDAALALADSGEGPALREALEEFQRLGARPAAAIVARRLRELGERRVPRGPRAKTRENPAGLTPRELEVLALLTEGLRNSEIAQRLVVSEKTVDHHVSAVLRKLNARSRGEAAAAAARLGIGTPAQ